MKHARPDYAPIQDPRGKIPDDEPVFLLRGQDRCAINALQYYANEARAYGAIAVADATEAHIALMKDWQRDVACKTPDLDPSAAPFNPLRDGKPGAVIPAALSAVRLRDLEQRLRLLRDRAPDDAGFSTISRAIETIEALRAS